MSFNCPLNGSVLVRRSLVWLITPGRHQSNCLPSVRLKRHIPSNWLPMPGCRSVSLARHFGLAVVNACQLVICLGVRHCHCRLAVVISRPAIGHCLSRSIMPVTITVWSSHYAIVLVCSSFIVHAPKLFWRRPSSPACHCLVYACPSPTTMVWRLSGRRLPPFAGLVCLSPFLPYYWRHTTSVVFTLGPHWSIVHVGSVCRLSPITVESVIHWAWPFVGRSCPRLRHHHHWPGCPPRPPAILPIATSILLPSLAVCLAKSYGWL